MTPTDIVLTVLMSTLLAIFVIVVVRARKTPSQNASIAETNAQILENARKNTAEQARIADALERIAQHLERDKR